MFIYVWEKSTTLWFISHLLGDTHTQRQKNAHTHSFLVCVFVCVMCGIQLCSDILAAAGCNSTISLNHSGDFEEFQLYGCDFAMWLYIILFFIHLFYPSFQLKINYLSIYIPKFVAHFQNFTILFPINESFRLL